MIPLFLLPKTLVLLDLVWGQNRLQVNLLSRVPDVCYFLQLSLLDRGLATPVIARALLILFLQYCLVVSVSVLFVRVLVKVLKSLAQFVPLILHLHTFLKLLLFLLQFQWIQKSHYPAICSAHYHFLHFLWTYLPVFAHVEVFICSPIKCHFEVVLCFIILWIVKSSSIFHHCCKSSVSEDTIE